MKTILALCTTLICLLAGALAQTNTGTPSFDPMFPVSAYESLDLATLNILMQAPVRAKEGPIPLRFMLTENVQLYVAGGSYATTAGGPNLARGNWAGMLSYAAGSPINCRGSQTKTTPWTHMAIVDGNGTLHPMPTSWDSKGCLYRAVDVFATDNSGYELVLTPITIGNWTATVYDRNGLQSNFSNTNQYSGTIVDPHQNTVTVSQGGSPYYTVSYADQLSSTAVLSYPSFQLSGSPIAYSYTDGTGVQRSVTVASLGGTSGVTFKPAFSCGGVGNFSNTFYPPSSVTFADTSVLTFTWELSGSGGYDGRLATLKVPTGATYTHSYSGGTHNDGLWCQSPTQVSNAILTISNGLASWTFARTLGSAATTFTTVTKPDGSKVSYTFVANIVTNKVVYDTDGSTVLDTWTYCYNSTISNCNSNGPTQNPSSVASYHYTPGVANPAEVVTDYDTYGNVTEVDRYDFGSTLASKSVTTYGSWNGSTCVSMNTIHVSGKPCDVQVLDAASNVVSHSRFNYNVSTGDLLNSYAYSSPIAYLTTAYTYNSNGTLANRTPSDGVQVAFGNSQCNGYLPDHATTAIGTASITWDCNGAVPLTTTDYNGLVVTTNYGDSLYRATQVSDSGNLAPLNYEYTSPTQFTKHMTFNNSGSITDTTTTLDGWGRTLSVQHQTAPGNSNYDTVGLTYDTNGRPYKVSMPCTATLGLGCSTPVTTKTYDGMNRPLQVTDGGGGTAGLSYTKNDVLSTLGPLVTGENLKQKQFEYNGLGQLVSVCEMTAGASPWLGGGCGQAVAQTGYLTSYAYNALGLLTGVTMNNQSSTKQSRSYSYDTLSRLLSETNPESGTTSYVYDTDATCGTSNGDLVKKTDAVGNVTCYKYDALHRNTSITHPSGSNASVTPDKCFVYDSATVHGVSMSNAKGRLAEAYTVVHGQGCSASKITDEGFSYSSRGEVSGTWEFTAAFGNWYQTTATYWANGTLATLGGPTSVPTFTFGVEGEGRISSVSGSSGQNPVTATSYNPGSEVTGVTLGSGDSDAFTFDSNTGRMTQYKATINGSSAFGNVTWNANGSLRQLAITDPFNSSNTQTCAYSQGDLASIKSVSCGSAWSQTFSYDPFGNITKNGSISWMPGYNTATNRYTLAGTSYDADGNLLTDTFHTYTWNSDGQPATVNTNTLVTLTYDALGRVVTLNDAGTKTDIAYTPSGRRFAYYPSGGFGGFAVDLPGFLRGGGQTANAGVQSYSHPDWLGSQRTVSASSRSYVGSLA